MNNSPMIVHCSAGIGRSGATIAIDMILNRIRTEGFDTEIEIPGLITHIRSQRSGRIYEFKNIIQIILFFFLFEVLFKLNDNMNLFIVLLNIMLNSI